MASPDPAVEERNYYLSLLGMVYDDPNLSLSQLREMTGGGANAARSALVPDWIFKNADGTLRSSKLPADFLATTPSLEDLSNTIRVGNVPVASTIIPIYGCLYPVQIEQVALVTSTDVVQSDANYWYVDLVRYRSGVPFAFTGKSTKTDASGGQAIAKYVAWNFNQSNFSTYSIADMGDTIAIRLIPVGAPPALNDVLITFRATPYSDLVPVNPIPVPLPIIDSFNRADGLIGNTETGQVWQSLNGVWSVVSNQAIVTTEGVGSINTLAVETGTPDCSVKVKIPNIGTTSTGIAFRITDKDNCFVTNSAELYRRQNGVLVRILVFSQAINGGDTIKLSGQGGLLTVYRQVLSAGAFTNVGSVVDTFNLGATKHGLRSGAVGTSGGFFDDFAIEALP